MNEIADKIVSAWPRSSLRRPHEQVWRDCFDPLPASWLGLHVRCHRRAGGQNKRARTCDSTATDAVRIRPSSIMSAHPANSAGSALDVGNETEGMVNAAGSIWRRKTLWENITWRTSTRQASKLYSMPSSPAGFALSIDEDKAEGGLRFSQWLLAGVYCSASKPGWDAGRFGVSLLHAMTAEQAVDEFGENEVSEDTRKLATQQTGRENRVRACDLSAHAEGGESAPREESAHCLGACRGKRRRSSCESTITRCRSSCRAGC